MILHSIFLLKKLWWHHRDHIDHHGAGWNPVPYHGACWYQTYQSAIGCEDYSESSDDGTFVRRIDFLFIYTEEYVYPVLVCYLMANVLTMKSQKYIRNSIIVKFMFILCQIICV